VRALLVHLCCSPPSCAGLVLLQSRYFQCFYKGTLWCRFITTPLLLLDLLLLSGVSVSTVVWCALRPMTYDALRSMSGDTSVRWTGQLVAQSIALFLGKVSGSSCRVIVADIFMIVLGLMGALSNHGYRWGWYAIGCLFQIGIVLGLVLTGEHSRSVFIQLSSAAWCRYDAKRRR